MNESLIVVNVLKFHTINESLIDSLINERNIFDNNKFRNDLIAYKYTE